MHIHYKNLLEELNDQERSMRWLSRQLGVHYQTVLHWKIPGIPNWHHDKISDILKAKKKELFNE